MERCAGTWKGNRSKDWTHYLFHSNTPSQPSACLEFLFPVNAVIATQPPTLKKNPMLSLTSPSPHHPLYLSPRFLICGLFISPALPGPCVDSCSLSSTLSLHALINLSPLPPSHCLQGYIPKKRCAYVLFLYKVHYSLFSTLIKAQTI